jgi:ribosomal protein S27AE
VDFRKYILDTERLLSAPVTGDDFDFQINQEISIECSILEHNDDSYIISVDEQAIKLLESVGIIVEGEMCTECGMGTMYMESKNQMRCDECGYSMTMEAAPVNLMRARELDLHKDMGDGYYIGSDLHDSGDNRKVSYSLYKLEDPAGLQDQFANAWRDVGFLQVSPYRATPEEIMAAAAQLKIKDKAMHMQKEEEDPYVKNLAPINATGDGNQARTNSLAKMAQGQTATPRAATQADKEAYLKMESKISEADYHGKAVTLGKPSSGDVKKYKVFVKDPSTGNIKKVNFGDPKMTIKRDNPDRRRNFRARHNCSDKKDRTTAGYWSCKMWSNKPVSKILKGE